ncbi:zinc metalloprotease [Nocardioides immobilis]|uniref:Zinc metalloprotease n=1 Tax=Nocardioides immobilis TaxID=2049295 RepID=A0A417Y2L3_9ACTN|nr:zinc metalloprotease [Nocardioides immobilis]RHW26902.1 zinc metalloprotease [Nocardioides immobilis]
MRITKLLTLAMVVGATSINVALAAPSQARPVDDRVSACVEGEGHGASARGGHGVDHRDVSPREQRAIARKTKARLRAQGVTRAELRNRSVSVPVYVHVMAASDGTGDVTDAQIADQIDVLNETFAGGESPDAADTGFSFSLAGTDRFYNDAWHQDHASSKYRKATRQGGANALNIWLVDFKYLGIATFPWDYQRNGGIDGIRVHYDSLPGGGIANYDLGETATHEAGHWFGLYHTFQGGCTELNDEVADTPAQSSPTSGCPAGRDSCELPGLDPIHNYMDYSYDSCYTEFSPGQASRAQSMWAAYRG